MNKFIEKFKEKISNYEARKIMFYSITALSIPLILMPFAIACIRLSMLICDFFMPKYLMTMSVDIDNYVIKLTDYIYYYISMLGIIVTGVLSYFMWKISQENYKFNVNTKEKEDKEKDEKKHEKDKQYAKKLHDNLEQGLGYLLDYYMEVKSNNTVIKAKPIVSRFWIRNSNENLLMEIGLEAEQIKFIWDFLDKLNNISSLLNNNSIYREKLISPKDAYSQIEELCKEVFNLSEPDSSSIHLQDKYEEILNILKNFNNDTTTKDRQNIKNVTKEFQEESLNEAAVTEIYTQPENLENTQWNK